MMNPPPSLIGVIDNRKKKQLSPVGIASLNLGVYDLHFYGFMFQYVFIDVYRCLSEPTELNLPSSNLT